MVSLPQQELCPRYIQASVQIGARRALDAVIRPENLLAVGKIHCFERSLAWVRRGKAGMVFRMPVLRQDHSLETRGDAIDDRYDLVSPRNGKGAATTEVVLDIDDEKSVAFPYFEFLMHGSSFWQLPAVDPLPQSDVKGLRQLRRGIELPGAVRVVRRGGLRGF